MSRAFLPIQPPHHACMNEGGRTGRNGGRMPANERRSREYRPAEQKKYLQATSTALRSRETPASRECRPAGQKKYLQAASAALRGRRSICKPRVPPCGAEKRPQVASAALRSRRSTSKPRELHHGIKKLQAARTRLSKQKKPLMIHLRF